MKTLKLITAILIITLPLFRAFPEDMNRKKDAAIGYSIDLLPTVLSAFEKKPGYSLQVWAGYDHMKIRFVSAHLYQPQGMIDDSFEDYQLNVAAFLIDWFPSGNLSGFWFGTGTELWNCGIRHGASGTNTFWTDNIITAGIGYVWQINDMLYIDPFAAVHYRMNDEKVSCGGMEFKRSRLSASASVKIGFRLNL